jgi:hypothetical protein
VFTPVIRWGRNTQTLAMLESLISDCGVRRLTPHRVLWYYSVYPKRLFKITIPSFVRPIRGTPRRAFERPIRQNQARPSKTSDSAAIKSTSASKKCSK